MKPARLNFLPEVLSGVACEIEVLEPAAIRECRRRPICQSAVRPFVICNVRGTSPASAAHPPAKQTIPRSNTRLAIVGFGSTLWWGKLILLPASLEFTPTCREHVLYPLALAAEGQGDDEAVRPSKDVHWGSVDLSRLATHMGENAEPQQARWRPPFSNPKSRLFYCPVWCPETDESGHIGSVLVRECTCKWLELRGVASEQRIAKPLYGLTPVSRVRIPPSPPDFQLLTRPAIPNAIRLALRQD